MTIMKWRPGRMLALVAGVGLGGCALVSGGGPDAAGSPPAASESPPAARSAEGEISALASFADTLSMQSVQSQRQELELAERELERIGGAEQRLRLVLVLTLADEELKDLERARVLLAESVATPGHPAHIGLTRLLAMLIAEQQERRNRQQLAAARQDDAELAKLARERAECQALEERLARLKDIERQLNERAQPATLPMDDDDDPTEDPAGRR